jgi:DNA-binding transcriptional LysR family regulator
MLEHWLGAKLLYRTTRRVSLTEIGETFYAQCGRILEDMEAARHTGQPDARLRGILRFTAPVSFGAALLGPLLVGFMQQNPELSLNVTLVDRPVDVIEEGYDLALQVIHDRVEDAKPAGMIVQRLMPMPFVVCAAPSYLARAGTPDTPSDLERHICVSDNRHPGDTWKFIGSEGVIEVPITGRLKSDNGLLRREAVRAGGGVLLAPVFLLQDDIDAGNLIPLLPGYRASDATLCAVCPVSRAALPKLRSLISFLSTRFESERVAA